MKSRNFEGVSGIGKHFLVNGNRVLTAEMHPRSGIQAIYDDAGQELLRLAIWKTNISNANFDVASCSVEQFYIPARRHWIPDNHFSALIESFNSNQKLTKWQWGNVTKTYTYDEDGKLY